jgi:hypothetical protein
VGTRDTNSPSNSRDIVVALAGRRIDAPDAAVPRFPPKHEDVVRQRIRQLFERLRPRSLVSSAACGADIVAQEVAGEMGIGRCVVLPFSPEDFRARSVADRGAAWGLRFDRLMDVVSGGVIDLSLQREDEDAFTRANEEILDRAEGLAQDTNGLVVAVIVWDGPRGEKDNTQAFASAAKHRGFPLEEVRTT